MSLPLQKSCCSHAELATQYVPRRGAAEDRRGDPCAGLGRDQSARPGAVGVVLLSEAGGHHVLLGGDAREDNHRNQCDVAESDEPVCGQKQCTNGKCKERSVHGVADLTVDAAHAELLRDLGLNVCRPVGTQSATPTPLRRACCGKSNFATSFGKTYQQGDATVCARSASLRSVDTAFGIGPSDSTGPSGCANVSPPGRPCAKYTRMPQ
eukprot:scaffold119837_cov69-Phaeocystis_antarctica.AAC.1